MPIFSFGGVALASRQLDSTFQGLVLLVAIFPTVGATGWASAVWGQRGEFGLERNNELGLEFMDKVVMADPTPLVFDPTGSIRWTFS